MLIGEYYIIVYEHFHRRLSLDLFNNGKLTNKCRCFFILATYTYYFFLLKDNCTGAPISDSTFLT